MEKVNLVSVSMQSHKQLLTLLRLLRTPGPDYKFYLIVLVSTQHPVV